MNKLTQTIRSVARQGNLLPAIVVDAYGGKATVRISTNGATYTGIDVIGNEVSVGDSVQVSFASGRPIVMASPPSIILPETGERTRPLAPIAHMNIPPVPATSSGSGIEGNYSTVDHRYIFVPSYGGSNSIVSDNVLYRLPNGGGPYSGGSSEIDYFGCSFYGGSTAYIFSMFACPFDVLQMTITPVAQLNTQLNSNLYLYFEAKSYPAYFTSYGSVSNDSYAEATLLATIYPFFRLLTELQITFDIIDNGDIFYLHLYSSGGGGESFYMIGFWVELIGVPSV